MKRTKVIAPKEPSCNHEEPEIVTEVQKTPSMLSSEEAVEMLEEISNDTKENTKLLKRKRDAHVEQLSKDVYNLRKEISEAKGATVAMADMIMKEVEKLQIVTGAHTHDLERFVGMVNFCYAVSKEATKGDKPVVYLPKKPGAEQSGAGRFINEPATRVVGQEIKPAADSESVKLAAKEQELFSRWRRENGI